MLQNHLRYTIMSDRYNFHLTLKSCPVCLLFKIHFNILAITTYWYHSANTCMIHCSPLVLWCGYRGFDPYTISNSEGTTANWVKTKRKNKLLQQYGSKASTSWPNNFTPFTFKDKIKDLSVPLPLESLNILVKQYSAMCNPILRKKLYVTCSWVVYELIANEAKSSCPSAIHDESQWYNCFIV